MAKRNGAPVDMHRSAWGALAVAVCMSVLPHAAMARTPLVQLDMSADSGDVATRADSGAASGLEQPHELRQESRQARRLQQASVSGCPSGVFINELHYLNTGTDEGNFFELAGPIGLSLDGYTGIFFEIFRSNVVGTTIRFDSGDSLSAVPGSGLGLLEYPPRVLGDLPDDVGAVGIADPDGVVCDFISYNGTITSVFAGGGFPVGVESVDIGLTESDATPVGASLGRRDGGTDTPQWVVYETASPAQRNPGTPPFSCPSEVFVNEIRLFEVNVPFDGGFVELGGPIDTSLSGLRVFVFDADSDDVLLNSGPISRLDAIAGSTLGLQSISFTFDNPSRGALGIIDSDGNVCDFVSWGGTYTSVEAGFGDFIFPAGVLSFAIPDTDSLELSVGVNLGRIDGGVGEPEWVTFDEPSQDEPNPGAPSFACQSGVVISEIHYQNTGENVEQFVELAGLAGTSVGGFRVVVYIGDQFSSDVLPTSASLPSQTGTTLGALAVTTLTSALPEGTGGIMLIDADENVCDFISYGGTVTSIDAFGVVSGLTSFDIGVTESDQTAVGSSLGRVDDLTGDPKWAVLTNDTPGEIGVVAGCPSNVFINELHYQNAGTDQGEFFELAGPTDTSLEGFTAVVYSIDATSRASVVDFITFSADDIIPAVPGSALGIVSVAQSLPDGMGGIGVVDADGVACDFISYGGSRALSVAAGGFPALVLTEDIGLTESDETAVGASLGRTDGGAETPVWVTFDEDSRGLRNPGTAPFSCSKGIFLNEFRYVGTRVIELFYELAAPPDTTFTDPRVFIVRYRGSTVDSAGAIDPGLSFNEGGVTTTGRSLGLLSATSNLQNTGAIMVFEEGGAVCDFVSWGGTVTSRAARVGAPSGLISYDMGLADVAASFDSLGRIDDGTGEPVWVGFQERTRNRLNRGQDASNPFPQPAQPPAAAPPPLAPPPAAPPPAFACPSGVVISEIHYQNTGENVGQFVELAGLAGTSVGGFRVVVYVGDQFRSDVLGSSSRLPSQPGTTLGALAVTIVVLPEGTGGIMLIDTDENVCDFISYGGTVTSVDAFGVASGLTSFDIGVTESDQTAVGSSLGRVDDLTGVPEWDVFLNDTPGEIGVAPPPLAPPPAAPPPAAPPPAEIITCDSGVFINEVHYRNTGDDVGEFVELAGPPGTIIDGFRILVYSSTGNLRGFYTLPDESSSLIAPSGSSLSFFVIDFPVQLISLLDGGLSLLDASNEACDFIGFGRTLTSSGGTFNAFPEGLTSFNTVVEEAADSDPGGSIGRVDDGSGTPEWAVFENNTRGELNTGQEVPPGAPGPGGLPTEPAPLPLPLPTVGPLRPPIDDPDFENLPDTDTPPGDVPPLVGPFISQASARSNPAAARFSGCGLAGLGCCIPIFPFAATGICFGGSICSTELQYPVCVDPIPTADSCSTKGGALVSNLNACVNLF